MYVRVYLRKVEQGIKGFGFEPATRGTCCSSFLLAAVDTHSGAKTNWTKSLGGRTGLKSELSKNPCTDKMKSSLEDVHIPTDSGLAEILLNQIKTYGSKTALVDPTTDQQLTYCELRKNVLQLAAALCKRGLCKDNIVLIACQNSVDYPIIFLAVVYLGGIVSTVNPQYKKGELIHQILDCQPHYVFVSTDGVYRKVMQVFGEFNHLKIKEIFITEKGNHHHCTNLETLLKEGQVLDRCHHQHLIDVKHQVAALPYSSGTTGQPKGVMLSHYNLMANLLHLSIPVFRSPLGVSNKPDTVIAVLPFFHIYGLSVILLHNLFIGNKIIVQPRFQLDLFLDAIQKYKVTFLYVVPPLVLQLVKDPIVSKYDLSSVTSVFSGAAPLNEELCEELRHRLHVYDIRQGYGMTECSPAVVHSPLGHNKLGSVGIIVPNTEVKIVDLDSGLSLGPNQQGEIWIRGPQVMLGYHSCTQNAQQCLDEEGWLRSGDTGYYDEDGFFFIVCRLKEVIKYKGFQVSPSEIESVLLSHPSVADAAVIGVADEEAGQKPKAFVVLKPKHTLCADDIISYVARELVSYKHLRGGIEFVESIPKSPSGKILRNVLQQRERVNHKSKL